MADVSDMAFWSLVVPPGKAATYEIEQSHDAVQYVHITNVALGLNAKDGAHALTIKSDSDGKDVVLATLDKKMCYQHPLDFVIDTTVTFRNHGQSELHLCGYSTTSSASDFEDDEGEEEDEDEDEEAPEGVPIANGKALQRMMADIMGSEDEDEDEDEEFEGESEEEGEDEDGMDFELNSDDLIAEADEDEEGEEGESEDEGEEEEMTGEGEEEGEEEEGESEEEEEPSPAPKVGAKRPAPAAPVAKAPMTPAPKKAKAAEGAKPPGSAPPKLAPQQQQQKGAAKKEPKNAAEYEAALVALLKSQPNGKMQASQIGTQLHRPADVPKMMGFIKTKPQLFKLEDNANVVALVKQK